MDMPIEISEQATKKAIRAIAEEVSGVAEVKDITYIVESRRLVVSLSVQMDLGTVVPNCAKELQKHVIVQLKDLMNLEARQVNVAVKGLL